MKRRKKLWIVCAALAVVVALCAFALLYRPVPYRFLEEASDETTGSRSDFGGPMIAFRSFRVRGTVDSVAEMANAELLPQDGWQFQVFSDLGSVNIKRGDSEVFITTEEAAFWYTEESPPHEPGTVLVLVAERATLIDRFLHWLRNR